MRQSEALQSVADERGQPARLDDTLQRLVVDPEQLRRLNPPVFRHDLAQQRHQSLLALRAGIRFTDPVRTVLFHVSASP